MAQQSTRLQQSSYVRPEPAKQAAKASVMAFYFQQQHALGYNLSMQGIGSVAIDGPRFE